MRTQENKMSAPQPQPHLKYLFEAHFINGDVITQDQKDESPTTPGKNCFHAVLERLNEVTFFGLFSDEDPNIYAVDLRTGQFSVNGVMFSAQDPRIKFADDNTEY